MLMPLLVPLGAAALMGRLGLGFYLSGLVRAKNAAGTALRALTDVSVAVLAFWAVGYALMEGNVHAIFDADRSFYAWGFFFAVMVLWASGPLLGATLERGRFFSTVAGGFLMAAVVVPLAAEWAWRGWLHRMGFIDVAGSAVFHLAGGLAAAAGAILIGSRSGKYNRDGSTNFIPGHSATLALSGIVAMLIGFVPSVMGMALAHRADYALAAGDALIAAAAGGVAALVYSQIRFGRPEVYLIGAGFLGGMISAAGAAGQMPTWAAAILGAVAGVIVPAGMVHLEMHHKIDDPGGGIAVHGIAGAWGTIGAGLVTLKLRQIGVQCL